jgi:hypothetical protein
MRLTEDERDRYDAAARSDGKDFSKWARGLMEKAAAGVPDTPGGQIPTAGSPPVTIYEAGSASESVGFPKELHHRLCRCRECLPLIPGAR